MTGKVTIGGAPVQFAFVHCWKEEGGFNGAPAEWGGKYSLNYSAGTGTAELILSPVLNFIDPKKRQSILQIKHLLPRTLN